MKYLLTNLFLVLSFVCSAQVRMKVSFIDYKGNIKTIKEAKQENANNLKYLIGIKSYSDTLYERLEYNYNGPIISLTSYNDSTLNIKNGRYLEYLPNGYISKEGQYINDKKTGSWYIYGDTAHVLYKYNYESNILTEKINLDSLSRLEKKTKKNLHDREAYYKNGDTAFSHLIGERISYLIKVGKMKHGGYVRIRFMINNLGKIEGLYLSKSAGFLFDEPCLAIIQSTSNDWIPAIHNDKEVSSYREQPIATSINNSSLNKTDSLNKLK